MDELENIKKALEQSEGNIILKAGAGTGKTYNLTERVSYLITGEKCRIDQILALTFTDFAAAEMRERIYARISDAVSETDDPGLREHLLREKREFGKNYISTFHSFCTRILQYYPDEVAQISIWNMPQDLENEPFGSLSVARLEAGFEILNEYDESILKQDWRKAFYKKYKEHPGLQNQLRSLRSRELEGILESIASLDEEDLLKLSTLSADDYLNILDELATQFRKDTEALFSDVRNLLTANRDWFKQPIDIPENPEGYFEADYTAKTGKLNKRKTVADYKELIESIFDPVAEEMKRKFDFSVSISEYLISADAQRIRDSRTLEEYNINDEAFWNMSELAELSLRWSQFLRFQRFSIRKLNFDDIIWLTVTLFRTNPGIAIQLQNRFRYVLVDEFQDTDQKQWEIVKNISRWDDGGNLLIVGDMKQAIYRFRGGEVTMMRVAEEELTNLGHQKTNILKLPYSFRSNHKIISFSNDLFNSCFSDYSADVKFKAEPQPLQVPPDGLPGRKDEPGHIALLDFSNDELPIGELNESLKTFLQDEKPQRIEALRIARLLNEIRNGNLDDKYHSIREKIENNEKAIGILTRKRTHQPLLEQALRLYHLPYTLSSGRGFFSNQEVMDCLNLLSFLMDAHDDLSFVGVLRSPFVGFSDAGLLVLRNEMDRHNGKTFWDVARQMSKITNDSLLPPDTLALKTAIPVLEALRDQSKYIRVSDLLEEAFRLTPYLAAYSSQVQIQQNLFKLLDIIRDLEQEGQGNLFEITNFLRIQMEQDSNEKDAELPDTGSIQIMTIHGSKGLEFPMVIIADMNSGSGNNGHGKTVQLSPSDAYFNGMPLIAYKDEDKANNEQTDEHQFIWDLLTGQNKEREIAEQKRLFYVAVTRAQTHLVLADSRNYPSTWRKMSDSFSGFLHSWLDSETEGDPELMERINLSELELQEIYSQITGEKDSSPKTTTVLKRELLDSETVTEALEQAAVPSRNVSYHPEENVDNKLASFAGEQWKMLPANMAGTLVHKLLELELYDPDDQKMLLENLLSKEGLDITKAEINEDLQRLSAHVRNAWQWLQTHFPDPRRVLHETAFECTVNIDGQPQYIRGVIDLMIEDPSGQWNIIDFKTNSVKDQKYLEVALLSGYDKQLEMYCQAAKILTDNKIYISHERAHLLFTEPDGGSALSLVQLKEMQ